MCESKSKRTVVHILYSLKTNPTNFMLDFTVLTISHKLSAALSFLCGLPLNSGNKQHRYSRSRAHCTNPEFKDERWCQEFRKYRDLAAFRVSATRERFWCTFNRHGTLAVVKWFRTLQSTMFQQFINYVTSRVFNAILRIHSNIHFYWDSLIDAHLCSQEN